MKVTGLVGIIAVTAIAILSSHAQAAAEVKGLRPPAVPLVTFDPYLSIWSEADHLNDDTTRHWTGREHSLVSLIRIDGKPYRLMGKQPRDVPPLPQVSLSVLPTRSIYEFANEQLHVEMTFMTAALPQDLDALAQPLSYITWAVRSADGKEHQVSLYDSTSSRLAVNTVGQKVQWKRETMGPLTALRVGTEEQSLLSPPGDDVRIDWGYAYVAAPASQVKAAIGAEDDVLRSYLADGALPAEDDTRMPRAANDRQSVLAFVSDLGSVGAIPVSRHVMVAYDEIYAIKYFGHKIRPYWRRNGAMPADLLQSAERNYPKFVQECQAFDRELMDDLKKVGGERYAQIAALAYRQCFVACGLAADDNGQPLLFTKENTSNGDIATVDVFFPMDPMMLLFSPTLAKASLVSNLMYAASPHWKFPNAPHDLGTYPVVSGRDDGGEGMPVEESGNMIILCDAVAREEGSPEFVKEWWPQLAQWAKYLEQYGLDPENQLCTDDFMGHLAHNANLSVKAILALTAYGDLCHMRGDEANATRYRDLARADAAHWMKVAADGDHYRLAFDKPNTWSQKYNLVWNSILGLNVFPADVARTEVAYYKKAMQRYGVPLDSRTKLTKTDWSLWSATMAESPVDFEAFVSPIWDYMDQTSSRVPLVDSYITNNAHSSGMHARPVVGGIFIKMLADPAMWNKWSSRDHAKVGNWAALPQPPIITEVVPSSRQHPVEWRYIFQNPGADWTKPDFDDRSWKQGPGGFGSRGTPNAVIGTVWNTDDIWLRRQFVMPSGDFPDLQLLIYHDEDVEVYVNGVLAAKESGFENSYQPADIRRDAKLLLKGGTNITLAVHCHQTTGGQGVDVGLVNVSEPSH